MSLTVQELKAIEALVTRAKLFVQDALTIAVNASDAGAVRTLKASLIRLSDTEATFEGRIKADTALKGEGKGQGQGQP
jgi:hypothetical protein